MITLPSVFEGIVDCEPEYSEFELTDPSESESNIRAWLGAVPGGGYRLITFAQDGTGSLFAVWLGPDHDDVETAPIVFLGSEGELGVLGKDPAAFLELLASGLVFDGHSGSFFDRLAGADEGDGDEDEEAIEHERARRSRLGAWVRKQIGKPELRDAETVRAEAEAAYPGFAAWVEANNAYLRQ